MQYAKTFPLPQSQLKLDDYTGGEIPKVAMVSENTNPHFIGSSLFKGGILVSAGQMAGYVLSFLRSVILARILSKSDFGLAAALWISVSLFEFVHRMGFRNQIIQAKEGDDPIFQGSAHAVQTIAGVVSALLLLTVAYPMAVAFEVPDLTWAFGAIALIPMARGLMHLDTARFQRELRFGPGVLVELGSQALITAIAWPVAMWLKDFKAALILILGKELLVLALAHLLASRSYRWAWNRAYLKQMMAFVWPLVLTGFVMFGSQQGDQMIVGYVLSLADLGTYSIAFELSSIPFYIFATVLSSLLLPTLAKHQDDHEEFQRLYRRALEFCVVGSMVLLGPLVVAGDTIVRLLYGPKYSGTGTLMAIFGAMVALRFFRLTPAIASMAKADTVNQLIGNIARSIGLLIALLVVAIGMKDMITVALCGLIGEVLAIVVSVFRMQKKQQMQLGLHSKPFLFLIAWIVFAVVCKEFYGATHSILAEVCLVLVILMIGIIISVRLFSDLSANWRELLKFRKV